jgi:hemolysin activation/secretion protein
MISSSVARSRYRLRAFLLGSAVGLIAAPVWAQDAAPTSAQASTAQVVAGDPPAAGAARHVDINEYFVEGNTILTDPEIEQAVYPYLGPDRTLDDVEKARAALQKVFEAKGLKTVFVEIPQQNVVGGRVRLLVTEAKVGKVVVSGEKHTAEKTILAALPQVTPGTVPNLNAFSADLTALNTRSSDRQVTPQLKAGAEPGTVDVDLAVDDKLPLHGSLEFNNKYSEDTTRDRLAASLRYDDLWGLGHSISGYYSVAPERRADAEVFVGSYGLPLGDTLRLDVTGLVSNSNVNTVGSTNVLGDGHSVTAVLTKTLPSAGGLFHRMTLSLAYKDFKEDDSVLDASTGSTQISKAPITYFPIAVGYAGTWTQDQGTLGFDLTGTFAFRGLGSNQTDFDNKRFNATGGFAYLHGGLNYLWNLPKGIQLYTSAEGQVANEPLISNEQMALGGAGSIRGYLQSEAIGDNGLTGSVELRSPSFASYTRGVFNDLRAITFLDGGQVWLIDPLAEQRDTYGLLSVGLGLRMKFVNHLSGDLDLGFPLTDGQATKPGDPRLHFRLSADF